MRTVLIGSVGSSKVVLEEMIRAEFPITKVYGLDETKSRNVSLISIQVRVFKAYYLCTHLTRRPRLYH